MKKKQQNSKWFSTKSEDRNRPLVKFTISREAHEALREMARVHDTSMSRLVEEMIIERAKKEDVEDAILGMNKKEVQMFKRLVNGCVLHKETGLVFQFDEDLGWEVTDSSMAEFEAKNREMHIEDRAEVISQALKDVVKFADAGGN